MLSLTAIERAARSRSSALLSSVALYTSVAGLTRRNWQTTGMHPPSLEAEEETAEPAQATLGRARRLRSHLADSPTPRRWLAHRDAMNKSFPEGWAPPKKLSREAMDGLRMLHAHDPETYTTSVLAERFKLSPEAVRRILKSKWEPTKEQRARLLERERRNRDERIAKLRAEESARQGELMQWRRNYRSDDKLSLT